MRSGGSRGRRLLVIGSGNRRSEFAPRTEVPVAPRRAGGRWEDEYPGSAESVVLGPVLDRAAERPSGGVLAIERDPGRAVPLDLVNQALDIEPILAHLLVRSR